MGRLKGEINDEFPVWRIVIDQGIALTEIMQWDLEDIEKANSYLDMKLDYKSASEAFQEKQNERQNR